MTATPRPGLCIAGIVPPGASTAIRCTHVGGHDGPHSYPGLDTEVPESEPLPGYLLRCVAVTVVDTEMLLDRLHEIKRDVPEGAGRDALLVAIDKVQLAWAAAAIARSALRDVRL